MLSILFGLLVMLVAVPTQAQQLLPNSPWYAVVYQPESDTLHWINAAGEQASMPRPTLPDEAQYLDLRISPNGRTMVMTAELNSGLRALGIYDFEAGAWLQTHQAQQDESIHLGGANIFTANSQYFAVGLFSGDFASPAWRVILFEAQTGNASAFIDHIHPEAPDVQLSAPVVQYLDGAYVHFQLIPQSVGGAANWPAYAWRAFGFDPELPTISESPYTRENVQVLPLTGQVVMSYTDDAFAVAPPDGQTPNFNAIGAGVIANGGALTTIHADGTRYHLSARWAKGGDWILFLSDDATGNRYWNAILADGTPGNNSHMPFDPQFVDVYGTSDGYLVINDAHTLMYTNGFMPNTALTIAQLTATSDVVYVTPIGVNFALDSLGGGGNQAIVNTPTVPAPVVVTITPLPPTETPAAPTDCSDAPGQRVSIGVQARVIPSVGGLNLRTNPNGAIILTLTGGDVFDIIGGPICDGGLYWWQIDRSGTIGWVAEATSSDYFIEPYDGPAPVPPAPGGGNEIAPPNPCAGALPPRLTVGSSATIVVDNVRPYNGPSGDFLAMRFYMAGTLVTVNAGPECSGGQYWWLITGQARVGRIGQRTEVVQGWITEATANAYNISP